MSLGALTMRVLEGAKGGAKFLAALKAGDVADNGTIQSRRNVCRECPTRVSRWGSDWCGTPFVNAPGVSCGCLLAGKTAVASESCPQGKWAAVTVEGEASMRTRRGAGGA